MTFWRDSRAHADRSPEPGHGLRQLGDISSLTANLPLRLAAFAGGRVHLVSMLVGYWENTRVLVDELRAYASLNGET